MTLGLADTSGTLKPSTLAVELFIAKFGLSFTFLLNYLAVVELFPTLSRATCSGVCNTSARIMAIFAPMVAEIAQPLPNAFLLASVLIATTSVTLL